MIIYFRMLYTVLYFDTYISYFDVIKHFQDNNLFKFYSVQMKYVVANNPNNTNLVKKKIKKIPMTIKMLTDFAN